MRFYPKKVLIYGKRQNDSLKLRLFHHNLYSFKITKPYLDDIIMFFEMSLNSDSIQEIYIPLQVVEKHQLIDE